jgi:hypothetical protein
MRISDLLSAPAVVEKLLASTPDRAVRELLGRASHPAAFERGASGRFALDRLILACGRGVALLRITGEKVGKPYLLVGRAPLGLSFPVGDDLVHVLLIFIGSPRPSKEERSVLTRLAASLSLRESIEALRSCQIVEHFLDALRSMDEGFSAVLKT